jgi:hypothetical protein
MTIVPCPDRGCAQPAEALDSFELESTDGPVEHVRTRCLAKHIFTGPADRLAEAAGPVRRSDRERRW